MLLDEIEEELNRKKALEPIKKFFYPTYERGGEIST